MKNQESPGSGNNSNLKARVKYFGSVRSITKRVDEEVEISSDSTVYELLQKLSAIYGQAFDCEVFQKDDNNLRDDLVVDVNGTFTGNDRTMETKLNNGDIISLFPIFPGGG